MDRLELDGHFDTLSGDAGSARYWSYFDWKSI